MKKTVLAIISTSLLLSACSSFSLKGKVPQPKGIWEPANTVDIQSDRKMKRRITRLESQNDEK